MFAVILWVILYAYLLIAAVIPYLRFDQAHHWDQASHLFAAWFNRYYLWPDFTGWNPYFFAGYAQNVTYGPLYHYIVALFSFPLGLLNAQKLITVLAILLLPLAIYYFVRKYGFNPKEASVMTFMSMFPVVSLSLACGGTLYSLFDVGLGPHALALPIYFVYIGKLKEALTKDYFDRKTFILLTLLAVLLLLTHFVVVLAAAISAFVLIAFHFTNNSIRFSIKHLILTLLCASFFLVPFFAYSASQVVDDASIFSMGIFLTIPIVLLIVFGGAAVVLDKDKRFDPAFFTLTTIFAVMVFVDFGQFGLPMDAYRFIFFFLVFAMLLPAKMLMNNLKDKRTKLFFVILFIFLLGLQVFVLLNNEKRAKLNRNLFFVYQDNALQIEEKINLPKLDGRIILFEHSRRRTPRAIRHVLAMKTGNHFLRGAFAESSANAISIATVENKLKRFLSGKDTDWKSVATLLHLYHANYLLSEYPVANLPLISRVKIRKDKEPYYLYLIGNAPLVELLKKGPEDRVEDIKYSIRPPQLNFKVASKQAVPILIKLSYFPRWKAYVNGERAEIKETPLHLMSIKGKGNVELKFEKTWVEYLGYLLSLIGLISLVVIYVKKIDI